MSRGRNRLGRWLAIAGLLGCLGKIDLARAGDDPRPVITTAPDGRGPDADKTSPAMAAAMPAPPGDKREQARLRLAEGNRLFRAADFDGATREYRAAYDLVPSSKLHFNIGLAEKMRGHPVEAARELDRFLAGEPTADVNLRADAIKYLDELSGIVSSVQLQMGGTIRISSVTIDGLPIELPPSAGPIRVSPGRHQIVIRRDDAPAWGRSLDLAAGASLTIVPEWQGPRSPVAVAAATHQATPAAPGSDTELKTSAPAQAWLRTSPGVEATSPAGSTGAPPIYRRWWFWAAVAGVTGAGFAAAAVWAGRGSDGAFCGPPKCFPLMKEPGP